MLIDYGFGRGFGIVVDLLLWFTLGNACWLVCFGLWFVLVFYLSFDWCLCFFVVLLHNYCLWFVCLRLVVTGLHFGVVYALLVLFIWVLGRWLVGYVLCIFLLVCGLRCWWFYFTCCLFIVWLCWIISVWLLWAKRVAVLVSVVCLWLIMFIRCNSVGWFFALFYDLYFILIISVFVLKLFV